MEQNTLEFECPGINENNKFALEHTGQGKGSHRCKAQYRESGMDFIGMPGPSRQKAILTSIVFQFMP